MSFVAGGETFVDRLARSWWRLLVLVIAALGSSFFLLYLLRGLRTVVLGAELAAAAGFFLLCFAHPYATLAASVFVFSSGLDVFIPGPVSFALVAIVVARALFDNLSGHGIDWGTKPFRVSLALLLSAFSAALWLW